MRLVVLISGSGSNLQAIINATHDGTLNAEIVAVISNRKQAYGLTRATEAGIPTHYHGLKAFLDRGQTREDYDLALVELIRDYQPDLIVLAGWMHILSAGFLNHFKHQVINLHPALPGQFAGINAIERAFTAFQQGEIDHSGIMVHYAIPEVDAGEVITQQVIPFQPDDTLESYSQRVHKAEHQLIVKAIQLVQQRIT